jgi:flagellar biosynthesis component FlhA
MINNKQILNSFKESAESLKKLASQQKNLLDDLKSKMNEDQLKEFQAFENLVKEKLENNDFNGILNAVEKMKQNADKL